MRSEMVYVNKFDIPVLLKGQWPLPFAQVADQQNGDRSRARPCGGHTTGKFHHFDPSSPRKDRVVAHRNIMIGIAEDASDRFRKRAGEVDSGDTVDSSRLNRSTI